MSVQGRRAIETEPVVVSFSGELDASDPAFGDELQVRIDGGASCLIVDLHNVTFIDSSVIKALILAQRRATAADGWLRVVYTHHVVRRVIEMCGLAEVFPQYSTVESAWRDLMSAPPSSEVIETKGQLS